MEPRTKRIIEQVGAALIIAICAYVFFFWRSTDPQPLVEVPTYTGPQLSDEELLRIKNGPGFQLLFSYTDRGFEPSRATVQAGDIVRFTNNSNKDLWVASIRANGNDAYPGESTCGQTLLDSCKTLKPMEFWEFPLDEVGTWTITNNLHKENQLVLTVQE